MQWTNKDRKKLLTKEASEMKSGVGNINTQFSLAEYEVYEDRYERGQWKKLLACGDEDMSSTQLVEAYALGYYKHVERGGANSNDRRVNYARAIYEGMVK